MKLVSPEKIEPLIFRSFMTDPKYATMLGSKFEKEWMDDEDISRALELVLRFHQKFERLPKFSSIEMLASKAYPDRAQDMSVKLRSAMDIDLDSYDSDLVEEEILGHLRNGGIYWTIMSNVDAIAETHSVEGMIDRLRDLTTMDMNIDVGFDYLEQFEEHCEEISQPEERLTTGWDSMDKVMNGGFYRDGRCLIVFMGQTHIGKSLILSNIAANLLHHGKFVVIISLEMSEKVYGTRIDAHLSKGDINKLKYNVDTLKRVVGNVKDKNEGSKLLIKEFPPDSITSATIQAYLDRVIRVYNRTPDVILIDYINLLLPIQGFGDNTYNKYKSVATELRALSYRYERPIVSLTQINRSGYNSSDADLDNTSDSMGIPHTADFVGLLWQAEGDREAEILNCKVKKNRLGGRIGQNVQFHMDYSNLRISDIQTKSQQPEKVADEIMEDIFDK